MGNTNVSPELDWSGAPAGTKSFALTLRDVSFGQPHWAVWNIPGEVAMLPADITKTSTSPESPAGSSQTNATFAEGDGYYGPQADCNVYEFKLYALSVETFTPAEPQYIALVEAELDALGDVILGQATLTARNDAMMMCE
jgi:Raf kinase inhibitor-like YbhB/YbcL family protein